MRTNILSAFLALCCCVSCAGGSVVPTPEPIIVVVTSTPAPATATPVATSTYTAVPSPTEIPTMTAVPSETTVPTETTPPTATTVPSKTPKPSKTPRPTATEKVTCSTQAAPFKARVLAVRKAYRPLVDKVYNYTIELVDASYDEGRVSSAFAGIDSIEVPACADVGEILYYFRLLRDTLEPAFIEMRIESNGHYPSADSFERVRGWHEEIKGFERNIDALIKTIP